MTAWQRDNPWRQACILSIDSVKALGLLHPKSSDDTVVLVISHDCDLAQLPDVEPHCEAIVGFPIENIDGSLAHAKNIRRLHLTFSGGDISLTAEFNAIDKRLIDKSTLAKHQPATNVRLTPDELVTLQTWLSVRYKRSSFATEFDRRIKDRKFFEKFIKIIKASGTNILEVLFDVDSGHELNREGPNDPYSLAIYLLFNVADDPEKAKAAAASAASEISDLAKKCFFIDEKWQNIELRECIPVSAAELSIHNRRFLKAWSFEYLSLREEPQGLMAK